MGGGDGGGGSGGGEGHGSREAGLGNAWGLGCTAPVRVEPTPHDHKYSTVLRHCVRGGGYETHGDRAVLQSCHSPHVPVVS